MMIMIVRSQDDDVLWQGDRTVEGYVGKEKWPTIWHTRAFAVPISAKLNTDRSAHRTKTSSEFR